MASYVVVHYHGNAILLPDEGILQKRSVMYCRQVHDCGVLG